MRKILFVLIFSGCVSADALKACGEMCKDHGGVRNVDACACFCERR